MRPNPMLATAALSAACLLAACGKSGAGAVATTDAKATAPPDTESGFACPDLKSGDPVAAARAAVSRGDCHLLMIGGIAGVVPGGGSSPRPSLMIAGTGDDGDATGLRDQCLVPSSVATNWAQRYNQTVVELDRAGACPAR